VLSDDLPRGRPTSEALVRELVLGLSEHRHVDLPRLCEGLGLPQPEPNEGPVGSDSPGLSKAKSMEAVFAQIDREEYLLVLQRFVDRGLTPGKRNLAEELIWAAQTWPEIDTRTRRVVAQPVGSAGQFWSDAEGLVALIKRRWVDVDHWSAGQRSSARRLTSPARPVGPTLGLPVVRLFVRTFVLGVVVPAAEQFLDTNHPSQ
jgi:hypothetical protein